ncbi:hypothetical protein ACS0TY_016415 [Phlomoides rotata]
MASKPSKQKPFFTFSFILFLFTFSFFTIRYLKLLHNELQIAVPNYPKWYDVIAQELGDKSFNIGLVNMDDTKGNTVKVQFEQVDEGVRWPDLFPGWIQENGPTECPKIPMPEFENYKDLDVVVARVPCSESGSRDVFRLQVNLVVANLLVRSGRRENGGVFAVFIGWCEPAVWEIFRCDDVLLRVGDTWVYKPELWRIKQKVLMPVGTCQLSPPFPLSAGEESWRREGSSPQPREAYVTVLHSSDAYVCGAIALAQSILRSNSTKDLLLLADDHLSPASLHGLRSAGWKIQRIQRIRSPYSNKNSYNEWNYSKLRIWQLTQYDKLIFIDSDFIVFKNLDSLFTYPAISAVGNHDHVFNSGLMIVEPSTCTFETLMRKRWVVTSYNGGDQGFLNEMFPWWHRLPRKVNSFKYFESGARRVVAHDMHALHFFGFKPWMCYRDYDCNWDKAGNQLYASDSFNERWWEIHDVMPEKLRRFCSLTPKMDARIRMYRDVAKNDGSFSDVHWKIKVKDPRQIV